MQREAATYRELCFPAVRRFPRAVSRLCCGGLQPVEHLKPLELVDAIERFHPRLEQLDPAERPVPPALARTIHARCPGRMNAADEDQPGIARRGRGDGALRNGGWPLASFNASTASLVIDAVMMAPLSGLRALIFVRSSISSFAYTFLCAI